MEDVMKRSPVAVLFLLGLASAASAQDGGKLPWRGKNEDPKLAMTEAHQQGRPMMLFFTSDG
jgi:hypothetical protein